MQCGFHVAPWVHAARKRDGAGFDFWAAVDRSLDEMAATGWDGVEISQPQFERYLARPEEFKRQLDVRGLKLASYYLARPFDEMSPAEAVEVARPRCEFHRAMGASVLLLDGGRRRDGASEKRIRALAESANAVGDLARGYGQTVSWHTHYGTMFERSAPFDRFMELTDPELVTFCPDTAQMAVGDYDLRATFEKYAARITYVHFKDIAFYDGAGGYLPGIPPGFKEKGAWGPDRIADVLEPGRGVVDVAGLYRIMASAGFDGWVVVDLDYTLLTPLESSRVTRENLARLIPGLRMPPLPKAV